MKKSLIVLLSVMVVLAFTASAFALHQVKSSEYTPGVVKAGKSAIELGGEIRVRGDVKKNTSDFNTKGKDTYQKYDQRVRLSTKANVTDKTMGVVELETNDNKDSSYDWGSATESKRDALYIRQAYISHQFGEVAGIKAGHMLLGLGNRLFFDHTNYGDDAALAWVKVGPGEVSFIDIKLSEGANGSKFQADDADAYVVALEMPLEAVNIGLDITGIRTKSKTLTYDTANEYENGELFYNFGVRVAADAKVVKIKADLEAQLGAAGERKTITKGNNVENTKVETAYVGNDRRVYDDNKLIYSGIAAMVGAEANVGPATVRGNVAYGSGDKVKCDGVKTDVNGDGSFNSTDCLSEDKNEGFRTFLTDNQYSTFIYDYSAKGASGSTNQGLTNTMYINLGASVKPMADLKLSLDAYYLKAAKEVALNGARKADGTLKTSKKLGYEVDAKIEYQLASNLAYYIEAGRLFAGEAYDRYDSGQAKNIDADDVYRVRHGLLLSF
jgi:uncharacterized protein YxeA